MSRTWSRRTRLVLSAVVMVALAALLIGLRYQLEVARTRAALQEALAGYGDEVGAALAEGEGATALRAGSAPPPWHRWRLSAADTGRAADEQLPVAESIVQRLIAEHTPHPATILLGPLGTESGRNVLLLVRGASTVPASEARGVWCYIDELARQPRLAALVRSDVIVQLYDADDDVALYQSAEGALPAPLRAALRVGATRLEVRASVPLSRMAGVRAFSPALLVLLGVAGWLAYEWRRSNALSEAQQQLAAAEARRKNINVLYGKALQDLFGLESRLQMMTLHDSVTGLANRTAALKRIESHLEVLRQAPHGSVAVLVIGFEHLNDISNSLGANFASRVLLVAAERIDFLVGSKELLFRIGDFNIAVILASPHATSLEELAEKIVGEIGAPIAVDSHTVMLHPTIGIAETSSGYEYAEGLLTSAHSALSLVGRDAPTRFRRFDATSACESISRLELEADLARAFDEQQLILEYEPFIEPHGRTVAGFEALIRWNHPTEGKLSPARFVPLALQAGWAGRLNNWVLREAVQQIALWRRAGHTNLFVNCNLTAEAFLRPRLADEIADVLAEFDLPGHQLVIELTESTLIQDPRGAARTVQHLNEYAVGTWLDDFGTGYSSLSHLRALPLKGVKIDRSFIERIEIDARDFGFLKGLLDLVSYLGLKSIAEGVETAAQFELLRMTPCDLFQGYYFAASMSASEAQQWIANPGSPQRHVATA